MMATGVLSYVQSLWPFATFRNDDLRLSDRLVRGLDIPDETKRFVFAIREPESDAVIYILCVQNLSERSAIDTERLVRCVKPGAVVAQVNEIDFDDVQSLSVGDNEHPIPTSSLEVLKRCFLHKIGKDRYENVAGSLVLKEIFGVGFNGHFSTAKVTAEEIGSSFLLLESPFVQLERDNNPSELNSGNSFQSFTLQPNNLMPQRITSIIPSTSSKHLISEDQIHSQTLKFLSSHLLQLNPNHTTTTPTNIHPKDDYEAPQYAHSVYPLLQDLHNMFLEIPSISRALAYAQNMLHDVNKGNKIDTQILSEIYAFRIAVEGLRIALNNAGRTPITKNHQNPKTEFSNLTDQEKSHALLANALRSQTKNFNSIVAILDASTLSGLRKHWNIKVPQEIENTIEELIADTTKDSENTNHDKKRKLKNKPVVAVGAGATAVLGASSLSKVVPASTLIKVVTFKVPISLKLIMTQTQKLISISISKFLGSSKVIAPNFLKVKTTSSSMKAAVSAEKIRTVVHSVIASAEKTSLSAMRSAFYEIMRKRRVRPIGILPWVTFGGSVATCTSLLVYGDGIECAVESLPSAPSIACLGRGIERLHQASKAVEERESFRVHKSIESLVNRFKKWKLS